jgi:hypothetical protein
MRAEVKKLWTEALASGTYKQCTGALAACDEEMTEPQAFCCLGVLCDLYARETGKGSWQIDEGTIYFTVVDSVVGERIMDLLPYAVMAWAGLTEEDPKIEEDNEQHASSLSEMNDNGALFSDIAQIVENEL